MRFARKPSRDAQDCPDCVRRGRWLVDDLQMGRADLVIPGCSLHDRAGSVSVAPVPAIQPRRGPLGWLGAVDVGRVGHGGHAQFRGHDRERPGRDGPIAAAVGGEVRCGVAFVVPAGFGLAQGVDPGYELARYGQTIVGTGPNRR